MEEEKASVNYELHESDDESETRPLNLHRRHHEAIDGNDIIVSESSSSSSSCSSAPDERDMKWALSSNALFFVGSALQTSTAIWDLVDLYSSNDDADGDDDDGAGTDPEDYVYWDISSFAVFLFILNALLDLAWTYAGEDFRPGESRFGDDPKWETLSAVAFGVGAVLEFTVATFLTDSKDPRSYVTSMVSMHIYLLSGLLALKGEGLGCSCSSLFKFLQVVGDVLFIAGSLVDVILSYLYDPEISNLSDKTLAWGTLTSALLWFLDAILYTAAECIVYSIPHRIGRKWSHRKHCRRRRSLELPRVIETRRNDGTK